MSLVSLSRIKPSLCADVVANPQLPVFRDVTVRSHIDFRCNGSPTSQKYLIETMPGGVAMLDYDGDGHQDLYVTDFGSNILYHNNGDGKGVTPDRAFWRGAHRAVSPLAIWIMTAMSKSW